MTRYTISKILFITVVLLSCGQKDNQKFGKITVQNALAQQPSIKPIVVDYKSDSYKISLGESYKVSEKVIDWHWDAMADYDDKIDSAGKDVFLYLGEPLIRYNNGNYLPTLHIETQNNVIISFTCSIMFDLDDNSTAPADFLNQLSKDIKKLRVDSVVTSINSRGIYEIISEKYRETYTLKKANGFENSEFEYTITLR